MTSATRPRPSLAEPAADTDEPVPLRRIAGLFDSHRAALAALFALIVVQAGLGVVSPFSCGRSSTTPSPTGTRC
ncbi:hypothetical protein AB0M83_10755 [Amycolatopsis sp. NPDC051106]|uniref:hypothetical protein n=1 Tax=unclassified Amycolatopsis TaxID=2618356 RepID=UPI00341392FF